MWVGQSCRVAIRDAEERNHRSIEQLEGSCKEVRRLLPIIGDTDSVTGLDVPAQFLSVEMFADVDVAQFEGHLHGFSVETGVQRILDHFPRQTPEQVALEVGHPRMFEPLPLASIKKRELPADAASEIHAAALDSSQRMRAHSTPTSRDK